MNYNFLQKIKRLLLTTIAMMIYVECCIRFTDKLNKRIIKSFNHFNGDE